MLATNDTIAEYKTKVMWVYVVQRVHNDLIADSYNSSDSWL